MLKIALPRLAISVSQAGGFGFLAGGHDLSSLRAHIEEVASLNSQNPITQGVVRDPSLLPIGIGVIVWGADLSTFLSALKETNCIPAAVWLFAPHQKSDLKTWTDGIRTATENRTKIWIQIGTVAEAFEVAYLCEPDVLVVQGSDAGGHGLQQGASIMTLLPEVSDLLKGTGFEGIHLVAAGGIMDGRGIVAALALGASGVAMGTRFLACEEANVSKGYVAAVLEATDGGSVTKRTTLYDHLRGDDGWPEAYGGRGVLNKSYWDQQGGMTSEENKRLYDEALKIGDEGWGENGRLCTYAGTGVGLVATVQPAKELLEEVRGKCKSIAERMDVILAYGLTTSR
ncbi:MAG: hypothetical protein MMC33_009845 [Icmadophila ericetorum]|nr:hypothetical protein [Icmadophila ericetorum]